MFLLELWPSCLVKSSRSPRFISSCFATYSSLSNRAKVLYPVPHHNFISPRGGAHCTRLPWLVCAPDQNRHAAQITSSSFFVTVCSAGTDRHGSIRHGIVTRNKLIINGPEGPPEGTVSRKPKIFSSFTQRDEEADRNIPSIYPSFVDQDQRLTLLTTQVKTYTWLLLCFRHASGTRRHNTRGGGGVPSYKRLMGMCRWMGSHFHDWSDYNAVAFSIELLEWGSTFLDFWG